MYPFVMWVALWWLAAITGIYDHDDVGVIFALSIVINVVIVASILTVFTTPVSALAREWETAILESSAQQGRPPYVVRERLAESPLSYFSAAASRLSFACVVAACAGFALESLVPNFPHDTSVVSFAALGVSVVFAIVARAIRAWDGRRWNARRSRIASRWPESVLVVPVLKPRGGADGSVSITMYSVGCLLLLGSWALSGMIPEILPELKVVGGAGVALCALSVIVALPELVVRSLSSTKSRHEIVNGHRGFFEDSGRYSDMHYAAGTEAIAADPLTKFGDMCGNVGTCLVSFGLALVAVIALENSAYFADAYPLGLVCTLAGLGACTVAWLSHCTAFVREADRRNPFLRASGMDPIVAYWVSNEHSDDPNIREARTLDEIVVSYSLSRARQRPHF